MLLLENWTVCDVPASTSPNDVTLAIMDQAKRVLGNVLEVWWENFRLQVEPEP